MGRPIAIDKGIAFAFPDVCKTPVPFVGMVPLPLVNIAQLQDADSVSDSGGGLKIGPSGFSVPLKGAKISTSSGDEAGTGKGVASSQTQGQVEIISGSSSVLYGSEGKGLVRFGDQTTQNKNNTVGTVLSAFPTVLVGE